MDALFWEALCRWRQRERRQLADELALASRGGDCVRSRVLDLSSNSAEGGATQIRTPINDHCLEGRGG